MYIKVNAIPLAFLCPPLAPPSWPEVGEADSCLQHPPAQDKFPSTHRFFSQKVKPGMFSTAFCIMMVNDLRFLPFQQTDQVVHEMRRSGEMINDVLCVASDAAAVT